MTGAGHERAYDAMEWKLEQAEAQARQLREALGACLWVLKKRHDAGTEAWESFAADAESKGYAALSPQPEEQRA